MHAVDMQLAAARRQHSQQQQLEQLLALCSLVWHAWAVTTLLQMLLCIYDLATYA